MIFTNAASLFHPRLTDGVFFIGRKVGCKIFYTTYPMFGECFHLRPPLKTSENQRFPGVFRGHKMGILARNRFIMLQKSYECLLEDSKGKS